MFCYIISYELRQPGKDYEPLYEAIRNYGTWAHMTESSWAVMTRRSAADVLCALVGYLDEEDRLLVIKSDRDAAWVNMICRNGWLQENLKIS